MHARTIEVLDQRGIADRFLAEGQAMQVQGFSMIPLDISDFPTRHGYGLALWQSEFEPILASWVAELDHTGDPTMRELREARVAVYGTDYKAHSPRWISRFTDMTRQAASYRRGRALLAGDAAHVHPPQGGQASTPAYRMP